MLRGLGQERLAIDLEVGTDVDRYWTDHLVHSEPFKSVADSERYLAWRFEEYPLFREFSGLGVVDLATPRRPTPKRYDFTEVLVIGAGASGLSAALVLGRTAAEEALA